MVEHIEVTAEGKLSLVYHNGTKKDIYETIVRNDGLIYDLKYEKRGYKVSYGYYPRVKKAEKSRDKNFMPDWVGCGYINSFNFDDMLLEERGIMTKCYRENPLFEAQISALEELWSIMQYPRSVGGWLPILKNTD